MLKAFFFSIAGLYVLILLDILFYNYKNNVRKNRIKEYSSNPHSNPTCPEKTEELKKAVCFLNGDISIPVKSNTFKELELQKTKKDADVITPTRDITDAMKINLETELENELYKDYEVSA